MNKLSQFQAFSIRLLQKLDPYELVKQLFSRSRSIDLWLLFFVSCALLAAIIALIINHLTYNYTLVLIDISFFTAIPGLLVLWAAGILLYSRSPRIGLFISSAAQIYFFLLVASVVAAALLTTPFSLIDHQLVKFDHFLGFSTNNLMNWVHRYHWFYAGLSYTYDAWFFELCLTPLVLACFNKRAKIDEYMLATFISLSLVAIIYYLWPTIAPAGVLSNAYFTQDQYHLVQRFFQVHSWMPVTVFDGGLIAFPSCHVINSIIVLYALRRLRILFYLLLPINICLIFSTLALGYHYLADVIAGFLVAGISILGAKFFTPKILTLKNFCKQ